MNDNLETAIGFALKSLESQNAARLTKREEFVKAAMQGLCAALKDYGPGTFDNSELPDIAQDAIGIADETLNQLRQTPEGE